MNVYSNRQLARWAGFAYLVVAVCAMISLAYVPSAIIDWQDVSKTVANIRQSELLFRFGILSSLVGYVAFLILPLILYQLFKDVSRICAVALVAFVVTSVPMALLNQINKIAIVNLTSSELTLNTDLLNSHIMLLLDLYRAGNVTASVFWGLWLWPLGFLIFKSGLLPRVLGLLLMVGCFGYLISVVGYVMYPGYAETSIPRIVSIPGSIGEIGTVLWLLVFGAREEAIPWRLQSKLT